MKPSLENIGKEKTQFSEHSEKELTKTKTKNNAKADEEIPCLHYAAQHNLLQKVNPDFLSIRNLSIPDKDGNTPLHLAAQGFYFKPIPQKIWEDRELLTQTCNHQGESIIHAFFTCRGDFNVRATKTIKKHCNQITTLLQSDNKGITIFHLMAREGILNQIPKKILSENPQLFTLRNDKGDTPLHVATTLNRLLTFPWEHVNQSHVTALNEGKASPLHYAAYSRGLCQIPKKYLTPQNLLNLRDGNTESPLDYMFSKMEPDGLGVPLHILAAFKPKKSAEEKFKKLVNRFPELRKAIQTQRNKIRIFKAQNLLEILQK